MSTHRQIRCGVLVALRWHKVVLCSLSKRWIPFKFNEESGKKTIIADILPSRGHLLNL